MRVYMPRHQHTLDLAISRRNPIKNSAGATFGTLRVSPTFQAPPTPPPLLTPTRTPPTAAPALTQPRTPAPPANARPARAPAPPPIRPPQHRTPVCRGQPGLVPTQTATRPPSAPIPAAALAAIADALFNPDALTMPLLGRLPPLTHPGALAQPIPGHTGGASVTQCDNAVTASRDNNGASVTPGANTVVASRFARQ